MLSIWTGTLVKIVVKQFLSYPKTIASIAAAP